ncbi:MAG: PilW family protein [Methylococcales bacterium]
MKMFRANSSQRGFTLIELMIAMLIGVFLMAGVIQIFLSAKQAYRLQENLSRLQENGRFAMDIITKDIRMAGYVSTACVPITPPLPAAFDTVDSTSTIISTKTWCDSSNRKCVLSTTSNTINNIRTDVIRSYQWTTLPLASCPPRSANATSESSYFIRIDDSNSNIPALWQYTSTPTTNERVEGIETMQILYGVDTDPMEDTNGNGMLDAGEDTIIVNGLLDTPDYIANYYVDASKIPTTIAGVIADWSRVVSVRITLLAVTPDNNLTDAPQPFLFNGTTYGTTANPMPQVCSNNGVIINTSPLGSTTAPTCSSPNKLVNDLRIRRVFSSTIAVRNRLP